MNKYTRPLTGLNCEVWNWKEPREYTGKTHEFSLHWRECFMIRTVDEAHQPYYITQKILDHSYPHGFKEVTRYYLVVTICESVQRPGEFWVQCAGFDDCELDFDPLTAKELGVLRHLLTCHKLTDLREVERQLQLFREQYRARHNESTDTRKGL